LRTAERATWVSRKWLSFKSFSDEMSIRAKARLENQKHVLPI
jgi:hypothetical protein